jgi:hypothetical protein
VKLTTIAPIRAFALAGLLVFAGALAGCDSASTHSGSATVRVHLTDFPLELVSEANVTIERVELIRAEGDVEVLAAYEEPLAFNLLDLRDGVTALLAEKVVPGGTFTQLRIVVGQDAEVVMVAEEGVEPQRFDLKVPSGTQTGIKMNFPQIVVEEDGEAIEITADFNVEESFVVRGNPAALGSIDGFIFKPVLRVERLEVNGEIVAVEE